MGDRLQASKPPRYIINSTQLPSAKWGMRTGQSSAMLYGRESEQAWLIPFVDKHWVAGKTVNAR